MAKRRFKVFIEVEEEKLSRTTDNNNIIEALKDEFSSSKASGVDVKRIQEDEDSYIGATADLPIYITVVDGKVTEIWYDSKYNNQDCILNERDFSVEYKTSQ